MADLSFTLPAHFGITGVRAKKERGCYFLNTANGPVKIHKSSSTPKDIIKRYNFLKKLKNSGFGSTDFILETPNGLPFVELGRDLFVMSRFVDGRELDLNSKEDVFMAVKNLASFHKAAQGIFEDKKISAPAPEVFNKQTMFLSTALKQINKSKRMSDFDMLTLKNASEFAGYASKAEEIIKSTPYLNLHENAIKKGYVCHNQIKEENLLVLNNSCFIVNFYDVSSNLQLHDLADFIRRYARKSEREISALEIIKTYDEILPVSGDAVKILYALLLYPWPFMKVVASQYSKKRNFTPVGQSSRMDEVLMEQKNYNSYINEIKI